MDLSNVSWAVPLSIGIFFIGLIAAMRIGWFSISKSGVSGGRGPAELKPILSKEDARIMFDYILRAYSHYKRLDDFKHQALEEAMRVYEEVETHVLAALKTGFAEVLERRQLSGEERRREARAYAHMMESILSRIIKDYVRTWFRGNHHYAKTETEWDRYKTLKKETLVHLINEEVDREWFSDHIDRDELRIIADLGAEKFTALFETLFNEARQISIKFFEQEQEEKARWSADMLILTGHDPYEHDAPTRDMTIPRRG